MADGGARRREMMLTLSTDPKKAKYLTLPQAPLPSKDEPGKKSLGALQVSKATTETACRQDGGWEVSALVVPKSWSSTSLNRLIELLGDDHNPFIVNEV